MKVKSILYLALILVVLLGCSFFSNLNSSSSAPQSKDDQPGQEVSTEGWLLPDPAVGVDGLDSYHQELTISFQGTVDGAAYEWTNAHQHDVWKKASADFWTLKTSETGAASTETLIGTVDQAHYSRLEVGKPCRVWWGAAAEGTDESQQPAGLLPPIAAAKEAGTETVNDVPAHHYTISEEQSGTKAAGDLWLAESGGYVVRYVLTISGEDGEQRYEYNLSRVNASEDVVYPEGCSAVLTDFPVMDRAHNLHRLPNAVDYTVSAETSVISKFCQDKLVAQGWTFVAAHDKDPKNVTLVFVNKDKAQVASILLNVQDKGVWVSAILRPWQSSSTQ